MRNLFHTVLSVNVLCSTHTGCQWDSKALQLFSLLTLWQILAGYLSGRLAHFHATAKLPVVHLQEQQQQRCAALKIAMWYKRCLQARNAGALPLRDPLQLATTLQEDPEIDAMTQVWK